MNLRAWHLIGLVSVAALWGWVVLEPASQPTSATPPLRPAMASERPAVAERQAARTDVRSARSAAPPAGGDAGPAPAADEPAAARPRTPAAAAAVAPRQGAVAAAEPKPPLQPSRRDTAAFFAGQVGVATLIDTAVWVVLPETTTGVPGDARGGCTRVACAAPANGTLEGLTEVPAADGGPERYPAVIYRPSAGFAGTDRFEYEGCQTDRPDNCSAGVATVTVQPVTEDQHVMAVSVTPVAIALRSNAPGQPCFSILEDPRNGSLSANGPSESAFGSTYRYQARAGFVGTDSFSFAAGSVGALGHCETLGTGVVRVEVEAAACGNSNERCSSGRDANARPSNRADPAPSGPG